MIPLCVWRRQSRIIRVERACSQAAASFNVAGTSDAATPMAVRFVPSAASAPKGKGEVRAMLAATHREYDSSFGLGF